MTQTPHINDGIPTESFTRLSDNEDYYNLAFKRTERIISATFYILSFIGKSDTVSVHYDNLSKKAMSLHETSLASLAVYEQSAKRELFDLQQALVALQGAWIIASAARVVASDATTALLDETDAVLRYIKNHYTESSSSARTLSSAPARITTSPQRRRQRVAIPQNDLSSDAILVYSDLNDRATRIKTVLEAKPAATIKDLSEIITDVSTKTIQRELNSLIEKGEIKRDGERRWSTYTIVS